MNTAEWIHGFFTEHAGDGAFDLFHDAFPVAYVPCLPGMQSLLYVQKPSVLYRLTEEPNLSATRFGLISQVGLPTQRTLSMLTSLSMLKLIAVFVDLDPVGLMIYAWLREMLPEKNVQLLGVTTRMQQDIGVSAAYPWTIPFEPSESLAYEMLSAHNPALLREPGVACLQLFEQHKKLELEVFLSTEQVAPRTAAWIETQLGCFEST